MSHRPSCFDKPAPPKSRFFLFLALTFLGPLLPATFFASASHAQQPNDDDGAHISVIDVIGNNRIDTATILSYINIAPGDNVSVERIDNTIKTLFATGLFADVNITQRYATLTINVSENPIINRIAFENNSILDDDTLKKETLLRSRSILTTKSVQNDIIRLLRIYRLSGRYAAVIEPKIIELPQNRIDLVFEIDEGPYTRIDNIDFIGNTAFSDQKLRSTVQTSETRWWRFLSATDTYDPDRLQLDQELLRRFYISNGYADFRVLAANAELTDDRSAFFITFRIDEGSIYQFGPSTIISDLEQLDIEALSATLVGEEGDTYNAELVRLNIDDLTIAARNQGYAFIRIEPRIVKNNEDRSITITYDILEGKRVYVERINIRGNVRTRDYVIRREIGFAEGDAYNQQIIAGAQRQIRALGFFSNVAVSSRQGSAPDRLILDVDVVEEPTGEISVGVGVSSVDIITGDLSFTERNFLGRGQFLRMRVAGSRRRQQLDFSFTEPYFLQRKLSLGVDLFARENDLRRESSYRLRQIGAGLRFGFPITTRSYLTTRYNYIVNDIYDVSSSASPAVQNERGVTHISQIGYTYNIDYRNDVQFPTGGWFASLKQDVAGIGGDRHFIRSEIDAIGYVPIPLFDNMVFSLRAQAGYIFGWNGDEVRINDRFFKGGFSFRGFENSGIGAREIISDDSLGGRTYAIGTAELRFPLGLPEELGFSGAIFSEFGTLFDVPERSIVDASDTVLQNVRDDPSLRVSVGASLLWRSPVGPFRFDFSHAVRHENYDRTEFFRFSGGTRF